MSEASGGAKRVFENGTDGADETYGVDVISPICSMSLRPVEQHQPRMVR